MYKKYLFAGISALFLCASIIISGYLIGEAIKSVNVMNENNTDTKVAVLNITEVADYLDMTEAQVNLIVKIEKDQLTNYGSFTGMMFPYYTVDDTLYFYKDEIDLWLQEVTSNHRYYDTDKGFQVQ